MPNPTAIAAERTSDKIFLRADGAIPYARVAEVMGGREDLYTVTADSRVIDAVELLAEHEGIDRGWYAGPIGWVGADGDGDVDLQDLAFLLAEFGSTC